VNHHLNRYREKVGKLLTSEEGLYRRSKRPAEPESVFGQVKSNRQYARFRHFNNDNQLIKMDFAVFAIAFNPGKMHSKGRITPPNAKNLSPNAQKSAGLSKTTVFVVFLGWLQKINPFYLPGMQLVA
jgi:hypothetical protein